MFTDLIIISDLKPDHNNIKRIYLFKKAKNFLPREFFLKNLYIVKDRTKRITRILKYEVNHVNYFFCIPKSTCFLNQKESCEEKIDLNIINQAVFQGHAANGVLSL